MTDFPFENCIFDPAEVMPREQRSALQLARLREIVARVGAKVPFYTDAFAAAGLSADSIRTLDDIRRFPFTTKAQLRDQYPLGMLAVPREQVVRFHGSSGTTGKPTMVAYTQKDLDIWSTCVARFLTAGGLKPEHTVHIAFGYGLFTGGFGLHYGVEKVGAAVLPAAAGNTQRHIMLLNDMRADALVCTPSYAVNIAEVARQLGQDPRTLPLRFGHFGGEPWTEAMRLQIESELDILAFNNYGLSEVIGPGVSGECGLRNGMHIQEDHFLVEVIDPATGELAPPGEEGELVFTSLTRDAMPIIRYRTRDIASLDLAPCPCGRTTIRMSRVKGRTDDMLIIRGVNVYPSQIEQALLKVDGVMPQYQIVVERKKALDELTVRVEIRPELFHDEMRQMQLFRDRIGHEIFSITGIHAHIALVEPQSIERSQGKAKRVIDNRQLS